MAQRTNSCPSPQTPVSTNAQTTDANAVSPSSNATSEPLPTQRRANTCPADYAGRREKDEESASARQAYPYTTTSQGWEAELPDLVFAASPGADQWQTSQTADGRPVYSTADGTATVEILKMDW